MGIRERIHRFWEAFFHSVFYLGLFAYVAISFFSETSFVLDLSWQLETLSHLKESQTYQLLKEFELHKIIPIFVIFAIGFATYIFDRVVTVIANGAPPFSIWIGSPSMYLDKQVLYNIIRIEGSMSSPGRCELVAKSIIEKARSQDIHIPGSIALREEEFSKVSRMIDYGKVGVIWVFLLLIYAVLSHQFNSGIVQSALIYITLFVVLWALGYVRQTMALLRTTEEKLRVASRLHDIMSPKTKDLGDSGNWLGIDEFELELNRVRKSSSRLVRLDWKPRINFQSLRWAFFGFNSDKN